MNISLWKAGGERFHYNSHQIFYKKEGLGPVLLLLHGFPTSSWDWYKVWPELRKKFTVLAFDFIGFGFSGKPKKYSYSLMDQANLTEALCHHLKIQSCHLLAHDYGDTVAQELLARNNDGSLGFEVKTCTLLNGGLFPGVHKPRLIQKLLMTPLGPIMGRLYTKRSFHKTFTEIFGNETPPTQKEIDGFWELINFNNGKAIVHQLIKYMAERVTHKERWLAALQQSKCPLRLINGAADPISGLHLVRHYKKVVPHPDCIVLDQIGHYPQVEAPDRVLEALFQFIDRQPS